MNDKKSKQLPDKFHTLTAAVLPTERKDKFLGFIPLPKLIVAEKASTKEIEDWGAARVFEEITGEKPYGDVLMSKYTGIKQGSITPDEKDKDDPQPDETG